MSSKDALLPESPVLQKLYDQDSMLSMDRSVASGFVVLLGGAEATSKKEMTKKGDISLGFLALTQGNVLDACFGVVHPSRREDTPATRSARAGKEMLDDAAATQSASEAFQRIAVEAYCEAFQAVLDYKDDDARLNCITRCFRARKIRRKAEKALRAAFSGLAEAIGESQ